MDLEKKNGRLLGQMLLDAGFLSDGTLELALAEQQNTNELLGQILVRMGVVAETDIKVALAIQGNIGNLQEAIRSAAGMRQMLGSLLVTSGHITNAQLEHAIIVQQASGEKLGEVFIRLGILREAQLDCLLAFQQNQADSEFHPNPLRLGEIMISSGYIDREQLDDALLKQEGTTKKIGEVLIEAGYAAPHHVKHGIRLQQRFISAALAAILAFSGLSLTGCGGGGGGGGDGAGSSVNTTATQTSVAAGQVFKTNYLTVTSEDYGLMQPTFYYSTVNQYFWSIQANVASKVTDAESVTVIRIDIPRTNDGWPLLNRTFSIEVNPQYVTFPGKFLVFNGLKSTSNKVESGIISFAPDSVTAEYVSGSFDVVMTDYDSGKLPAPKYSIKGIFSFRMGEYGPADLRVQ